MKRGLIGVVLAVTLVAWGVLGCGGNGAVDPGSPDGYLQPSSASLVPQPAGHPALTYSTTPLTSERFSDIPPDGLVACGAAGLPPEDLRLDQTALPPLPVETFTDGSQRLPSAVTDIDLSAITASSAAVTYDTGVLTIPSLETTTEWVRYALPLPMEEDLLGLTITGTLTPATNGKSTGLWVGFSDYSHDRWVFRGPFTLGAQVILNDLPLARYSDPNDVTHVILVTARGDSAQLTKVRTVTETSSIETLPAEFTTAMSNADLYLWSMSLRKNHALLNPIIEGVTWAYGNWGWYIYSYDGGTSYYEDCRTMLPSFWSAWSGETDPGFFEPLDYPEYMTDKHQTLADAAGLQDVLLAGIAEMPADKQSAAQSFNPTLQASDALARAVADFVTVAGGTADYPAYQTALNGLDDADQQALARVVVAAQEAFTARDTALAFMDAEFRDYIFHTAHGWWVNNFFTASPWVIDTSGSNYALRGLPYNTAFFDGSLKLADAIDQLKAYIDANSPTWADVNLEVDTPAGLVTISGLTDDTHLERHPAIIAKDQGTNTYTVAGDMVADFPTDTTFTVYHSTNDNGLKTVVSAALDGADTDIVVAETLTDGVADGEIHLNGHALLIDLGGADSYTCAAGATATSANGVAVCLDLAGNDSYLALDDPLDGNRGQDNDDNYSQYGAGRLGIGMLVDFDGTDTYDASRMSEGFAMFGVGVQADYGGGDDIYTAEAFSQGSAIGGIGLLFDDGGSVNTYDIWAFGQGFGGVMGIGMLCQEGTGNDIFDAVAIYDAARPEYNSPQLPDAYNANFVQGAALGMQWSDGNVNPNTGTRFVAAGGYGLLYDAGGDDSYYCGIFGQGVGFFQGHGLLIDSGGGDGYLGIAYCQATGIACGLGGLWEGGGDDNYGIADEYALPVGLGGSNNMALAWLYDLSGNDAYWSTNYTLGTGYQQGYGFFIDVYGNDQYSTLFNDPTLYTLGRGGWPATTGWSTAEDPAIGIFVDARGADEYGAGYAGMLLGIDAATLVETPPDNGASWTRLGAYVPGGYYTKGYSTGIDGQ